MDQTLQLKLWLPNEGDYSASAPGGPSDLSDSDEEIRELLALVVEAGAARAERPVFGDPKPGWRTSASDAADAVATLSSSVPLLMKVITALRGWLAPRPGRTIKIEIEGNKLEINGISEENLDQLVEAWVRKACQER